MTNFIKYSFIVVFFGSIAYLFYAFNSIDPAYKKEIATVMKERRNVIEDQCKFIEILPERYICFYESAQNLEEKLKMSEARVSAYLMYKNTFELNLNNKTLNETTYVNLKNKLMIEVAELYQIKTPHLMKELEKAKENYSAQ